MSTLFARSRLLKFAALPLLVVVLYAIALAATATVPTVSHDYVAAVAAPFDLMVTVPILAYVLVLRRAKLSPLFALPLVWVGYAASTQIVPPGHEGFLSLLLMGAVAADVAVIGHEALRIVHAFKAARATHTDPVMWFAPAIAPLFPNPKPARLMGLEAATMYYAFGSWKKKPDVPKGARAFTTHEKNGQGALIGGLMLVLPAEVIVMHLLISKFSPEAALVVTALSLYSMVWIIGIWRAMVLRPVLVTQDELVVRYGVHFTARIPLEAIASVGDKEPDVPKAEKVNQAAFGSVPTWITLNRAVPTETLLGGERLTRALALNLDNPAALASALKQVQR